MRFFSFSLLIGAGAVLGHLYLYRRLIRYTRGLYRHEDSHVYVSRGCGFWGPPARVGSAPEITRLTLSA